MAPGRTWREIRGKLVKPEDEPHIAEVREQMETDLAARRRDGQAIDEALDEPTRDREGDV
jgi:hypothetical protein